MEGEEVIFSIVWTVRYVLYQAPAILNGVYIDGCKCSFCSNQAAVAMIQDVMYAGFSV